MKLEMILSAEAARVVKDREGEKRKARAFFQKHKNYKPVRNDKALDTPFANEYRRRLQPFYDATYMALVAGVLPVMACMYEPPQFEDLPDGGLKVTLNVTSKTYNHGTMFDK